MTKDDWKEVAQLVEAHLQPRQGGGQLAEYIKVKALKEFLPNDLVPAENDQIPALTWPAPNFPVAIAINTSGRVDIDAIIRRPVWPTGGTTCPVWEGKATTPVPS